MPRFVDAEQRRSDILEAASAALSEEGYGRMTMRSLAKRMGGSSTLVTHYFPTKDVLVTALVEKVLAEAAALKAELETITDPGTRLRALLENFLPTDKRALQDEQVRVALLPYKDTDPAIGDLFARMEPSMREVIRTALEGAVDVDDLDEMIDLVRAWCSGVCLSVVEHPELWPRERQLAVNERFLALLPLRVTA